MVKVIDWNIARRDQAWRDLLNSDADIALLQEAAAPPPDVARRLEVDPAPWQTAGAGLNRPWRAAVAKLSDRVGVQWLEPKQVADALPGELAVSRAGTLAAAIVRPRAGERFIVASMYAPWESPHATTGSDWIYADGSVHRLISDLSALLGQQSGHRILAAGDLNILHGYGEHGSEYWASRYETVFKRMSALGLTYLGPKAPAGRRAEPWPDELPKESNNVPTYRARHQTPETATRQLDFVFASASMEGQVQVRALNQAAHWGPSDHCRVEIEVN
jgi:endonuclease/exonuclease/phosphatase family metal-dependent hydrolase